MMRTLLPTPTLPEKTRPKAMKRLPSEGIILEMYIISGASSLVSHVRIA